MAVDTPRALARSVLSEQSWGGGLPWCWHYEGCVSVEVHFSSSVVLGEPKTDTGAGLAKLRSCTLLGSDSRASIWVSVRYSLCVVSNVCSRNGVDKEPLY